MKNSAILLAVGKDTSADTLTKKLEGIRAIAGHASVVVINEVPPVPYYTYGFAPYGTAEVPEEWQTEVTENKAAIAAKAIEVKTLLQGHDVSGDVSVISCETSGIAEKIAARAMVCDMVYISEDLRKNEGLFDQILYGTLFKSPVGVLLNDTDASVLSAPKTVFVAWNSQLQSSRAVHQALPMLRSAQEVIVGTIDAVKSQWRDGEDPGVDIAKWLAHHGCKVTLRQYSSGGQDIAARILDLSKEAGADLIVSGSYGHSRARQAIFGGTTRGLIEQTDQTVFMAH